MEDNKLIAEFMGIKLITDTISWFDTSYKPLKKYNESWDWLMPVVEKIESLNYMVNIGKDICIISATYDNEKMFTGALVVEESADLKLLAVYKAVITFIKWYNEKS